MRALLATALILLATQSNADDAALFAETKKAALEIPPKLLAMLQEEIGKGDFNGAIAACSERAPKMAAVASQATGWEIRRVSLRNRNAKAIPDSWERAALEDFDRRAAAGENPATLEKAEIIITDSRRTLRFMKALPTQQLCLNCHGNQDQLAPRVKAKLNEIYPDDPATGYSLGQIRGALTVKRPL